MSYDIDAYRFPADMPPKVLTDLLAAGEGEEHALALDREERERLAADLLAVDPSAERHDLEDAIEIDSDAMQLFVSASGVSINIPYHGLGDAGQTTIDEAYAYADVMRRHGLTVWDPQAESVITGDDDDKRSAADRFAATSEIAQRLADDPSASPRWKFWKR